MLWGDLPVGSCAKEKTECLSLVRIKYSQILHHGEIQQYWIPNREIPISQVNIFVSSCFFLSLGCIYYLFCIFNVLLWGNYFYLLPSYCIKYPVQWNVVRKCKEKILKLHKYPFLVLNIWEKWFKEKALHHVEGKKIIMIISIQDQHVVLCIQGNTY